MSMFMVPDDAKNCEGVSGQAWRNGSIRIPKRGKPIPSVTGSHFYSVYKRLWYRSTKYFGGSKPSHEAFKTADLKVRQYAEKTFVDTAWVWRRLRIDAMIPTEILAVRIVDLKRNRWGVLVMDSCNNVRCIDTDEEEFVTALEKLISKLNDYGVFDD